MCMFYVSVVKRKCPEAAVSGLASGLVNWPFVWRLKCPLTFAILLHQSTFGEERESRWSAGRPSSVSFASWEGTRNSSSHFQMYKLRLREFKKHAEMYSVW